MSTSIPLLQAFAVAPDRSRGVRTLSNTSGLRATSPDALRHGLLGPWAEGLRQYLVLRLGSVVDGQAAFDALREELRGVSTAELIATPGPRAQLYARARRMAADWVSERGPDNVAYRVEDATLERIRAALTPFEAELLELHHARELSSEEIAFVLDAEPTSVEALLVGARRRAVQKVGAHAPSRYLDAFAVAPAPMRPALHIEEPLALRPGTMIAERYRLGERVGLGAFGDVYEAEDVDVPGHRVALKILRAPALSAAAREHALRELKHTAAVFHPSIVLLKDHGWHEDRLWFVMPWYDGATLESRLASGALSRREAYATFAPLARALAALHGRHIRHQDVKPDNIFLARVDGHAEPLPVLLDLGVAAADHEALLGGTPVYFAPEVAAHYLGRRAPDVGPAADVFALALALRNALEPDTEEDVTAGALEAFIARRSEEAPAPPLGPEFRDLRASFARWLAVDPELRPSAEALSHELEILLAPERARAARRGTTAWLAVIGGALTATVSLAVLWNVRMHAHDQAVLRATSERLAQIEHSLDEEAGLRASLEAERRALRERFEDSMVSRDEWVSRSATLEIAHAASLRRARVLAEQVVASEAAVALEREGSTQREAALQDALVAARSEADSLRRAIGSATDDRTQQIAVREERIADLQRALESARERLAAVESSVPSEVELEPGAREESLASGAAGDSEPAQLEPTLHIEP